MLKISVVVPCLNAEKYIKLTLDSILAQDYPETECIVMDGGSTDKTLQIVDNYMRRSRGKIQLVNSIDKNEPDAINKGMAIATGNILTFIDADDVYHAGAFKRVNSLFEKNPWQYWLYGRCHVIDPKGKKILRWFRWTKEVMSSLFIRYQWKWLLYMFCFIPQPAVFWRRQAFDKLGGFRDNLKYVFDYEYWLRLMNRAEEAGYVSMPIYCDKFLASWRKHPASVTGQDPMKLLDQTLQLQTEYTSKWKPVYWIQPLVRHLSIAVLRLANGR